MAASLRAFPWGIHRSLTLTAIRCEVSTLIAGTTFRLGLYADDGTAYPGALVSGSDVGTFDSAAAGVKLNTFGTAISLAPGLYWLAVNHSGAPTLRAVLAAAMVNILGANPAGGVNSQYTGWSIAQAYAALPTTFPAGGVRLANTAAPWAMFRVQ